LRRPLPEVRRSTLEEVAVHLAARDAVLRVLAELMETAGDDG
jgi:hypothetical protein